MSKSKKPPKVEAPTVPPSGAFWEVAGLIMGLAVVVFVIFLLATTKGQSDEIDKQKEEISYQTNMRATTYKDSYDLTIKIIDLEHSNEFLQCVLLDKNPEAAKKLGLHCVSEEKPKQRSDINLDVVKTFTSTPQTFQFGNTIVTCGTKENCRWHMMDKNSEALYLNNGHD